MLYTTGKFGDGLDPLADSIREFLMGAKAGKSTAEIRTTFSGESPASLASAVRKLIKKKWVVFERRHGMSWYMLT